MRPERDLLRLRSRDIGALVQELRVHFDSGSNYVFIGPLLLAINPQSPLPSTNEGISHFYHGHRRLPAEQLVDDENPHIYGLARQVFIEVALCNRRCSIIFLGESGSGKTFNSSLVVQQLIRPFPVERLKGTPLTSHESLKNMPFHERSIIALSVLHNLLQAGGQYNFRSSRAATVVELLHEKNGSPFGYFAGMTIKVLFFEKWRAALRRPHCQRDSIYSCLNQVMAATCGSDFSAETQRVIGSAWRQRELGFLRSLLWRCVQPPELAVKDWCTSLEETVRGLFALGLSFVEIGQIYRALSCILVMLNLFTAKLRKPGHQASPEPSVATDSHGYSKEALDTSELEAGKVDDTATTSKSVPENGIPGEEELEREGGSGALDIPKPQDTAGDFTSSLDPGRDRAAIKARWKLLSFFHARKKLDDFDSDGLPKSASYDSVDSDSEFHKISFKAFQHSPDVAEDDTFPSIYSRRMIRPETSEGLLDGLVEADGDSEGSADGPEVYCIQDRYLNVLSTLLEVDMEDLRVAILGSGKEKLPFPNSIARWRCDSAAVYLYQGIVKSVLGRINKQTEATHCEKESGRNSVLIVDPPGIERSEVNRFAELCRNLACEAISYWFSQSFVLDFQRVAKEEGIEATWNDIVVQSGENTLDLVRMEYKLPALVGTQSAFFTKLERSAIHCRDHLCQHLEDLAAAESVCDFNHPTSGLGRPPWFGVSLSSAASEARRGPDWIMKTKKTLPVVLKRSQTEKAVAIHFEDSSQRASFAVTHYFGEVKYSVLDWVQSNECSISDTLRELLVGSSFALVRRIFEESREQKLLDAVHDDIADLHRQLAEPRAHYVGCLRPNDNASSDEFADVVVKSQLEALQVENVVESMHRSFEISYKHAEFTQMFGPAYIQCVPPACISSVRRILAVRDINGQVTNTRVFLTRADNRQLLEGVYCSKGIGSVTPVSYPLDEGSALEVPEKNVSSGVHPVLGAMKPWFTINVPVTVTAATPESSQLSETQVLDTILKSDDIASHGPTAISDMGSESSCPQLTVLHSANSLAASPEAKPMFVFPPDRSQLALCDDSAGANPIYSSGNTNNSTLQGANSPCNAPTSLCNSPSTRNPHSLLSVENGATTSSVSCGRESICSNQLMVNPCHPVEAALHHQRDLPTAVSGTDMLHRRSDTNYLALWEINSVLPAKTPSQTDARRLSSTQYTSSQAVDIGDKSELKTLDVNCEEEDVDEDPYLALLNVRDDKSASDGDDAGWLIDSHDRRNSPASCSKAFVPSQSTLHFDFSSTRKASLSSPYPPTGQDSRMQDVTAVHGRDDMFPSPSTPPVSLFHQPPEAASSGVTEDLYHFIWFHGLMGRFETESLLHSFGGHCFLLRESTTRCGATLSSLYSGEVHHFLIGQHKSTGSFLIVGNARLFDRISDLVTYYQLHAITLEGHILGAACPRFFGLSQHEIIHHMSKPESDRSIEQDGDSYPFA